MPLTNLGQILKSAFDVLNLDANYRGLQAHSSCMYIDPLSIFFREGAMRAAVSVRKTHIDDAETLSASSRSTSYH